jgi:hypothetical protein
VICVPHVGSGVELVVPTSQPDRGQTLQQGHAALFRVFGVEGPAVA